MTDDAKGLAEELRRSAKRWTMTATAYARDDTPHADALAEAASLEKRAADELDRFANERAIASAMRAELWKEVARLAEVERSCERLLKLALRVRHELLGLHFSVGLKEAITAAGMLAESDHAIAEARALITMASLETDAELRQRLAAVERERNRARERAEKAEVQLAGCGAAALGYIDPPAKPGDYGWSASYGDVLMLRHSHAALEQRCAKLSEAASLYRAYVSLHNDCDECERLGKTLDEALR